MTEVVEMNQEVPEGLLAEETLGKKLITVQDLCRIVGSTPKTLRKRMRDNEINKPGTRWEWPEEHPDVQVILTWRANKKHDFSAEDAIPPYEKLSELQKKIMQFMFESTIRDQPSNITAKIIGASVDHPKPQSVKGGLGSLCRLGYLDTYFIDEVNYLYVTDKGWDELIKPELTIDEGPELPYGETN